MQHKIDSLNLRQVTVDSAGTAGYHINKAPDERTQQTALKKGYDLSDLRARKIQQQDFNEFDVIFAMDSDNLESLRKMQPSGSTAKLKMATCYSSLPLDDVPDPYYGGADGFDEVLQMCEKVCDDIINVIKTERNNLV
jgi:protein-tyrosine phosphatase